MPGFDRSGPMGLGPMTGGRRGLCNPVNTGYDTRFSGVWVEHLAGGAGISLHIIPNMHKTRKMS
jgi:hypothetical protein